MVSCVSSLDVISGLMCMWRCCPLLFEKVMCGGVVVCCMVRFAFPVVQPLLSCMPSMRQDCGGFGGVWMVACLAKGLVPRCWLASSPIL